MKKPTLLFTSLFASLVFAIATTGVRAADLFVSPAGSDRGSGARATPFATLQKARDAARAMPKPVTIHLAGGTYYLPETLVLGAEDSGVAWQADEGEAPIVSGGVKLDLKWTAYKDGIQQAKVPDDLVTEELFVNGERQVLARYPNFDPQAKYFDGYAADAISKQRAARWADPAGGYFHAMHPALWGGFTWRITGKDANGEITKEGGWQNNRGGAVHQQIRFVENIFEELDAPREWFLNRKTHILYFYPPAGLDLSKATMEATRLTALVELRGTQEKPVRSVTLKGLAFRHANRTVMETKEPLLRTDWALYRGGAIFIQGAEDCLLEDLLLDQVGGNAIFVNHYNRRVIVRGCEIVKAGASGVSFVGDPQAARNPLFNYDQRQKASGLDRTPGPKTDNYPADCLVENCLIHLTGRVEKQTAGVNIDVARNITVRHCSIYDMPRAGINIGDGCWGGHVVEWCDVFDTVKETGDHGSFNSWGRDRWWELKDVGMNDLLSKEATKDLVLLDCVQQNVLRNNRWRCDHGWDIDLDDGSSNYWIHDNLCLSGGIKNREGYLRIDENNIMVGNSFHPHVWCNGSQDVFRRNIVFTPYRPIGVRKPWGKEVDWNLLYAPGRIEPVPAQSLQNQSGRDEHSEIADAMFVDPAHGDYRVKPGSPAMALGFKNFPMDQFGVTSPRLKAKARTPILPGAAAAAEKKTSNPTGVWLGAKVRAIGGMEFSAYGVAQADGGVVLLDVPADSAAARAGLKKDDLIQGINASKVSNVQELTAAYSAGKGPIEVRLVRGQKPQTLKLPAEH
jgi:hypothetical protein